MKKALILLFSFLMTNVITYSQTPPPILDLERAAVQFCPSFDCYERIADFSIEDALRDVLRIKNGTSANGQYIPHIIGHRESDSRHTLHLTASTSGANDIITNRPLMIFDSRIIDYTDVVTDDINSQENVVNRLLFGWYNYDEIKMTLSANGNLGLGTINPEAKIQVSDGDVYIEDINKGVIMKSPNGSCWRITIGDDGSLITTLLQDCP